MASKALVPSLGVSSTVQAGVLFGPARLSDRARGQLPMNGNARSYLDALLSQGAAADVLHCLSRALPKQYSLAWVCECLKRAAKAGAPFAETDRVGLALAEAWLAEPSDVKRADAAAFAQRDGFKSVGGWVAAAAGWMGGSLGPSDQPTVPPPEHLPGEAAVAALLSLAARSPATQKQQLLDYAQFALRYFGGAPGACA
jgi:hypothetical protein